MDKKVKSKDHIPNTRKEEKVKRAFLEGYFIYLIAIYSLLLPVQIFIYQHIWAGIILSSILFFTLIYIFIIMRYVYKINIPYKKIINAVLFFFYPVVIFASMTSICTEYIPLFFFKSWVVVIIPSFCLSLFR